MIFKGDCSAATNPDLKLMKIGIREVGGPGNLCILSAFYEMYNVYKIYGIPIAKRNGLHERGGRGGNGH